MSEEEIIVSAAGVSRRVIPPSEDHSDAEVTASGEQLDRLVAEIVFGLREGVDFGEWPEHDWMLNEYGEIDHFAMEIGFHNGPVCKRCSYSYCEHCLYDPEEKCSVKWPSYRHRAEAVIDKLREHGYWCEMRSPWTADAGAQWWAGFTPHATTGWNGRPDHWHSGDTLPEAVCRAAVATLLDRQRIEAEA